MIELSATLHIPEQEYANQGNAILGIRDSGKSYTATWLAEQLLGAGIPFVAFDPIGVWRNLKLPGTGKGFEIVVAGDDADLPLTPESAPEIVRAAMRENIPLVIDLYSMSLSKADWKRIVEACVRILLFENKRHGLRHVFIEEAAEFAPQRVGPDVGRVYAEIEKLARMGGNAGLGYTLINQRAEEVNKAILELCDCLFLHRQKGRHSLTALGKWMDAADATGGREVVKSLPSLEQGDCWVWSQGRKDPVRVHIPAKRSHHPDRRNLAATEAAARSSANVSGFVARLSGAIEEAAGKGVNSQIRKNQADAAESLAPLQGRITLLEAQLQTAGADNQRLRKAAADVATQLQAIVGSMDAEFSKPAPVQGTGKPQWLRNRDARHAATKKPETSRMRIPALTKPTRAVSSDAPLSTPQERILASLGFWESVGQESPTRQQVAAIAGYKPGSGNFGNLIGGLRSAGLIEVPGPGRLKLTNNGTAYGGGLSHKEAAAILSDTLSDPQKKLVRAMRKRAGLTSREALASLTEYAAGSGNFGNLIGSLCTLDILTKPAPGQLGMSEWAREVLKGGMD